MFDMASLNIWMHFLHSGFLHSTIDLNKVTFSVVFIDFLNKPPPQPLHLNVLILMLSQFTHSTEKKFCHELSYV